MESMEEKLGTILSNPQMMQQIMSMAQALGQSPSPTPKSPPPAQTGPNLNDLDFGMIQKLSGLMKDSSVTSEETSLLKALTPYLNNGRIQKLEKAMRAAKLARLASSFLGAGGLQMMTGR
jgi:hypothetical protein